MAPWAAQPNVPVANPERVLQSSGVPIWRRCYQKGLETDPTQAGSVLITIHLMPDGEVSGVNVEGKSGVSPQVTACALSVVRRLTFQAPGSPGSTLRVMLRFALQ